MKRTLHHRGGGTGDTLHMSVNGNACITYHQAFMILHADLLLPLPLANQLAQTSPTAECASSPHPPMPALLSLPTMHHF
uniref:Uncharacterized protein n=1 Tax=Knipowitschia caucasica TaxID=637954 RepID=A0AAV2LQT6_KNICA